ncbi:MAG: DUF1289 domain-containing protein [Defluviicoccus sp.]|nr:DUF1289 domain-containing protein [Defluviicoccus sp.]MDG4593093.1 DUF1289 domain-containing protein [Defluviicoccus sp.]MDS4009804.1 DUF1289 domain-containing protein [Defluviicoccus sp.]MDS4072575.1 DUF1289 domain-containing protein [Defluviicoccus sp.]
MPSERKPVSEVASPCIGVCRIAPASGLCTGCLRTRHEIARWRDANAREKRRILQDIARRRATGPHSA